MLKITTINYEDWNKILTYRDDVRHRTLWEDRFGKKHVVDIACDAKIVDRPGAGSLGHLVKFIFYLKDNDGNRFGKEDELNWDVSGLQDARGDHILYYINKTVDRMCEDLIMLGRDW